MASQKSYLNYILEQLSGLNGIRYRAMMGEFVLYYQDRVFGGIYDDRFLVKPVPAALKLCPNGATEIPHPGAKPMILVDNVDDRVFLETLLNAMLPELPHPAKR